jgi:CRISPR/Cas system CMR-associated protein Cmr5 small subunit
MLELKDNEFTSPSITINNDSTSADISYLILKKVKTDLKKLQCNTEILDKKNAYKGIFSTTKNNLIKREKVTEKENNTKMYALIDVSSVDISCLNLSTICFALPTEIANINSICDIPISEDVIKLFTYLLPELGVLYKKNSCDNYLLPDIVYTRSDLKQAEFQTIFGPPKKNIYYHFCKSFLKDEIKDEINAVNRYALFIEDPITIKISISSVEQLVDLEEMLHKKYSSRTCIIVQNGDILVKKYELFTPMSYHAL